MYRLAFYENYERIELNFLPTEGDTAEAMGQDAANQFGGATLMYYDGGGISVVGKFFPQRNVKAVA